MHSEASDWLGPSEERNILTAHASKILHSQLTQTRSTSTPARATLATAPSWQGEALAAEYSLARRMCQRRARARWNLLARAGTCWRLSGNCAAQSHVQTHARRAQCSQQRTWSTASADARARRGGRGCPAEGARYCHGRTPFTSHARGAEGHNLCAARARTRARDSRALPTCPATTGRPAARETVEGARAAMPPHSRCMFRIPRHFQQKW